MSVEPSVRECENYRAALIAQAIWNVQIALNTKKGSTPKYRELHEFILRFGDDPDPIPKPTRRQTPAEQGQILRKLFGHKTDKKPNVT